MNTTPKSRSSGSVFGLLLILLACLAISVSLLFSRVITYTESEFVNVFSLTETQAENKVIENTFGPGSNSKPGFEMQAEAEIFKFSYEETGKITVIGPAGNPDHLIAPGTNNLYQFTLANTGNVPLDYTLTLKAWVTGTDLWLPVNARLWDYNNKYLVGSAEEMPDVMELNTVTEEKGELGAGRYAVYNLEWEWPFERDDDEYDTMLGDLAVDEDLVLHIGIYTLAEYDEEPEDPNAGLIKPPHTGDDSQIVLLSLLCGGSFVGLCGMIVWIIVSGRKKKKEKQPVKD